jgi:hypothetical protein
MSRSGASILVARMAELEGLYGRGLRAPVTVTTLTGVSAPSPA